VSVASRPSTWASKCSVTQLVFVARGAFPRWTPCLCALWGFLPGRVFPDRTTRRHCLARPPPKRVGWAERVVTRAPKATIQERRGGEGDGRERASKRKQPKTATRTLSRVGDGGGALAGARRSSTQGSCNRGRVGMCGDNGGSASCLGQCLRLPRTKNERGAGAWQVKSRRQVRARHERLQWHRKRAETDGSGPRSGVRVCIPDPTEILTTLEQYGPQELLLYRDRDRTASDSAPVDPGTRGDGCVSNECATEPCMPYRGTASLYCGVVLVPCSPVPLRVSRWSYGSHTVGACTKWSTFSLGWAAVCHLRPTNFHEI